MFTYKIHLPKPAAPNASCSISLILSCVPASRRREVLHVSVTYMPKAYEDSFCVVLFPVLVDTDFVTSVLLFEQIHIQVSCVARRSK